MTFTVNVDSDISVDNIFSTNSILNAGSYTITVTRNVQWDGGTLNMGSSTWNIGISFWKFSIGYTPVISPHFDYKHDRERSVRWNGIV